MKRLLTLLALLFVSGLVTTIGVAWLFAALDYRTMQRIEPLAWHTRRGGQANGLYVGEYIARGRRIRRIEPLGNGVIEQASRFQIPALNPPSWSAVWSDTPKIFPGTSQRPVILEYEFGWPLISMRCTWRSPHHRFLAPGERITGGIPIVGYEPQSLVDRIAGPPPTGMVYYTSVDSGYVWMVNREILPLVPAWPGLLASALLYGAAAGGIVVIASLPAAWRRHRRRRRGRCVRCGYPLARSESTSCPECGWATSSRLPFSSNGRLALAALLALLLAGGTATHAILVVRRFQNPPELHLAARFNDVERVKMLVENGADPDRPCGDMWRSYDGYAWPSASTPLMWAAAHGNIETIEALTSIGVDVNRGVNQRQLTALAWAARYDHPSAIDALLAAGADPNVLDTKAPLIQAARFGSPETLQRLLRSNVVLVKTVGQSSVRAAAGAARVENLRMLLDAGAHRVAPIDAKTMELATITGGTDVVRLLLEAGGPVNSGPLLWHAAEHGQTEVARILIDAGADPNREHPVAAGWSPLRRAVLRSNLTLARILIDAGADPLVIDEHGETLVFAIRWYEAPPDLVEFVLSLGIDVDQRSKQGNTALVRAVQRRMVRGVECLLMAGADPAIANNRGHTAFDHARERLPIDMGGMAFGTSNDDSDDPKGREILELLEAARAPGGTGSP